MKIRLLTDIPIDPDHGLTKGRVLEAVCPPRAPWETRVVGDIALPVKLLESEFEVIDEDEEE